MRIRAFRRRTSRGASSVEYALIVTLIAIAVIGAVTIFGGATAGLFTRSCSSISTVEGGSCG